jgi:hypothetical protein
VVGGDGQWRRIPGSGRTAFARPWVVPIACVGHLLAGAVRGGVQKFTLNKSF